MIRECKPVPHTALWGKTHCPCGQMVKFMWYRTASFHCWKKRYAVGWGWILCSWSAWRDYKVLKLARPNPLDANGNFFFVSFAVSFCRHAFILSLHDEGHAGKYLKVLLVRWSHHIVGALLTLHVPRGNKTLWHFTQYSALAKNNRFSHNCQANTWWDPLFLSLVLRSFLNHSSAPGKISGSELLNWILDDSSHANKQGDF